VDMRSTPALRLARSRLSVAISVAALGVISSFGSTEAMACTPYPPANNDTVTCSSAYWLGFASSAANLTVTVNAGSSIIQTSGGGGAALLANGGHLLLTISGTIDPSGLVAMPVLTSGVIAGNGSASSIIIQSDNNGIIRGTARSPSAFLTTFAGMAVEVWNAVGGQTRINNAGLIASRDIAGLSTPTVAADNALMAIRGGGQVIMSNVSSGRIIGRVAFERSSGLGNTFLNAGSIRGSLSMGAGGVNEFTAVTLGSLTGDGSTTGSLGNSLGYNLTFAPTGQVDGGAGGVNTLKLRNPGSSGSTGAVTISASQYVNFNYLEINGGTWTINGPLLSAASTSTTLASGTAIVDNSLVFGNGSVQANGGTLQSSGTNVNLANSISMNASGLTVTGSDNLTLSGVISGASGTLSKSGAGSLTLNRLNSYSGMTNLNAGTLILGHNNALGNSTLIVGGGTLEASTAITVGNGISVTAPAMTVGGSNNITLTGLVNVGAKLVKQGTSNLTLSSSTVFSGGADLKGGTLTVGSGSALGSSNITVSGASSLASLQSVTLDNSVFLNSNLTVTGSNDLQLNGVVSGSGKLIKAGTGTLILNAVNTHTGGVELQGGTLRLDAYGLGPGGLKVSGDSTLDVRTTLIYVAPVAVEANLSLVQASNTVLAGILSGSGTLTKTGISTLRLDNTDSTFNGTYDIQQGFLTNNAVNALGVSPSVNLAGVSVLNVSASGTVGALTGSGAVAINGAATLTVGGNNQSSTFSGAFSGAGGLVKTGSGTLNLSNTSINSGSTQVNGGTLNLSGRFSSSTVTVNSGGTLRSTGQLDGGVIVRGGGALALAGGTAGAVQVQTGGSLLVNGGAPVTTGELFISNGGILTVGLGQISTTPIINVQGNLTLDGIILNLLDAGNISNGVHRLMNYSGTLTYNGHILGSLPTGVASNQLLLTLGAGQVNLLVSSPSLPMQFWDGSNTAVSGTVEGGSGTWNGSLVNWTNALGSNNWAWASQGAVFQGAAGTVTVDAAQSVSFLQFMTDGYSVVSGSNGSLSLNPGVTGSTEMRVDAGVTATLGLSVLGGSRLDKVGSGTLVLAGSNGYYAGTRLAGGTLLVGHTNAMGSGQVEVLTGTTLGTTTALSLSNSISFSGASTLDVSQNLSLSGTLSGLGSVSKTGTGTLTLTSGGSSLSGALTLNDGALVLTRTFALGTAALIANNNTSLSTTSALTLGNAVTVNGNLTLPSNNDLGLSGVISGAGTLIKQGNGTLTLSGSNLLTGTLRLDSGTLRVDGSLGNGSVMVRNGGTLTGSGTLGGTVSVADGGHLNLAAGSVLGIGSLVLNDTSQLNVSLGTAVPGAAGLANINGNLTLDGQLNVTDIGGFGMGVYRLFDYSGTLTDNGLAIGTLPAGLLSNELEIQTGVSTQVNLVVGSPDYIRFWDGTELTGNGAVEGGNGVWNSTSSNWATLNAGLNGAWNNSFAVFQGAAGTVSVDGAQSVSGLQFISDGYQLVGGNAGSLQLVSSTNGYSTLRVDNGVTATLDVNLDGSGLLNKLDRGTLVLNGNNSYSGGTRLSGGTLVVGSNAALGTGILTSADLTTLDSNRAVSLSNAVTLNGSLTLGGSNDLSLNGTVSGIGALVKNGSANLTLNGNNRYSGGTLLNAGSLTLGHNTALGTGTLTILGHTSLDTSANLQLNNAIAVSQQLSLAGSHDLTLSGVLSGNGSLIKNGNGQLLLSGTSTYTGNTLVNAGDLTVNGNFASTQVQIASGASLSGSGSIAGQVSLADGASLNHTSSSAPLSVGGLALAAASNLNFALGAPGSSTAQIKVNGDLTLDGTLNISNSGSFGTGLYPLFSYGGNLTDNGLSLGNLPGSFLASQMTLQTSMANQINLLVNHQADPLLFWNGAKTNADGSISGGSGVWGPDTNWTNASGQNASGWSAGQFGVFAGPSGTITVAGVQSFAGLQFLTDGYQVLAAQGDGLAPTNSASGALAAVRVSSGASTLLGAVLSGSGGIEKLDGGTLILAGNNTYSGGTTVTGGTLQGSTFSLQGSVVNNATLIFQQTGAGEFAGTLSGSGTTIKRGVGTLLLTGANDFSGLFSIEQGVLQLAQAATPATFSAPTARMSRLAIPVDNGIAADITVAHAGGLSGTGTVNSLLNHGTVQPGSGGNLNVTGDFRNASDGTLNLDLGAVPNSYLAVGGVADLAGTLNIAATGPYTGDTTYTLLSAAGGINGRFDNDNVSSQGTAAQLAFIDTTLRYGANDLSLTMARNDVAFADVAQTGNQRSVATALDATTAPASLRNTLLSMNRAAAQSTFDSLSGEIHASTASALLEDSRYVRNSVNDRMRQGACASDDSRSVLAPSSAQHSSSGCQGQGVGWLTALGGWSTQDASQGMSSTERDSSGFMLGYDNSLNQQWRAGIAAGQTNTSLKAQARHSNASVDSYHLASYLNYQLDAFAARMGVAYTWHNIDSKRQAYVGSDRQELKAKYKAHTAQAFAEVAYVTQAAGLALEPFAALAYIDQRSARGREKGGDARLQTQTQEDMFLSTVGLRVGKQLTLANGSELTPRASIGWRHAYGDATPQADLHFIAGNAAFSSQGSAVAKDAAVLEAGLDLSFNQNAKLGLGYSGQLGAKQRDHAISVSFSLGF
jgi:fibronectin-binding autotransporter adhesin